MADTEEQNFAVHLIHAADRTLEPMRRERERISRDCRGVRTERREREGMIAATHVRHPAEDVRGDAKARVHRRGRHVKRRVVVVPPRRHDDGALLSHGAQQRLDYARGPSFDRAHGAI